MTMYIYIEGGYGVRSYLVSTSRSRKYKEFRTYKAALAYANTIPGTILRCIGMSRG